MAIQIKKKDGPSEFSAHLGTSEVVSKPVIGQTQVLKVDSKAKTEHVIKDKQETLHKGVMMPAEKMCVVMAGGSQTVNLGNYESAKISVSLSVPCAKEDINETYEFATQWVSEKITEAVKDAKA